MRYGLQNDLAALAPVLARPQRRTESSLDHRIDGLYLPSLSVFRLVSSESLFHHAAPTPYRRLVRRPAPRWRNDRPDTEGPHSDVGPLSVEASVSQQCANPRSEDCLTQRRAELHQVRARAAAGHRSQDHVALAIDHQHGLGVLGVSDFLAAITAARAPLDVIPTHVPRLQPRAIDGRPGDAPFADFIPQRLIQHGIEHLLPWNSLEEPGSRFVKRGEVGNDLQSNQTSEVGLVSQIISQPPIVNSEELLEHQASQQLRLCELLGAELMAVRWQRSAGGLVRNLQNAARRFASRHI